MSSDYLPFAYTDDANVLSKTDWAALTDRPKGFKRGLAVSRWFNTAWRQTSVVTAAIAHFIDTHVAGDVIDDGDVPALAGLFEQAVETMMGGAAEVGAVPPASPFRGRLWWDTDSGQLYVWTGLQWVSTSPPTSAI
jgi:hypothetical protein